MYKTMGIKMNKLYPIGLVVFIALVYIANLNINQPEFDNAPVEAEQRLFDATNNKESSHQHDIGSIRNRTKFGFKFYILEVPELTTWLVGNYTQFAYDFYETSLREQQAEMWLHKGFQNLTEQDGKTTNILEADVIFLCGYFHLNHAINKEYYDTKKQMSTVESHEENSTLFVPYKKDEWIPLLVSRLLPNKVYVNIVPTWNPKVSNEIGLASLMKSIHMSDVQNQRETIVLSVGFERNQLWQRVIPERIIPIPYVVKPTLSRQDMEQYQTVQNVHNRTENFVFYVGDYRKHATEWSGCNRSMVLPLWNQSNMYVRLVNPDERLNETEYHHFMFNADYCLILCGDTPSSRTLSSAILHGCIPIRIGSRLRGLCDLPCHPGWGWSNNIHNFTHLPYSDQINWTLYPEVNEAEFVKNPVEVLDRLLQTTISNDMKNTIRASMFETQFGWTYGWGNPVNTTDLGDVSLYTWDSIKDHVSQVHRMLR